MKTPLKVVLHVSTIEQIPRMQSNIVNLLKEDPTIDIKVVINGNSVTNFTKDKNITLNNSATHYLCNNSLKANSIENDNIIKNANITPSGVYKLVLLQSEGYLYIKVWNKSF